MQRTVTLADGAVRVAEASSPAALSISAHELVNTFGPEYRMLLIGAGQLAEYLATMARFSGFAVTLCDPRARYRSAWSVPGVITTEMPDDAVMSFRPDRRSCVVGLTHDPEAGRPGIARGAADRGFLCRRDRFASQRPGAA